jgi:hypothetical protein
VDSVIFGDGGLARSPADARRVGARGTIGADRDTITDDKQWKPGTWEPSLQALYA